MATSSSYKKKLAKAKKRWKKARKEAEESAFAEFEDGRYIAKLTGAELGESQSSERLQIHWTWTFQEGDYEGQKCHDYDGCETDDNLVWVGRKFSRLGYEIPEDFDDIPESLEEIVADGVVARIVLKTSGEYQNIQIQRVLSTDDEDEYDEDEGEEPDEDSEEESDEDEEDEDDDDEEGESEDSDDEEEDEEEDSDDDEDEDDEDETEEEEEDDDEEEEVPEEPKAKARKKGEAKGKGKKKRK